MDDLVVDKNLVIPGRELSWRFSTTGGPGGQHADRSATRAELRFDIVASEALDERAKTMVRDRLGGRIRAGVLAVVADDTRSQWRNRELARERLADMLRSALEPPKERRGTRPTRASLVRRRERKRRRSETKRLRRKPGLED